MKRAMIDIETLDIETTAVVFQIGLLVWTDEEYARHEWNLDVLPQILRGRTINQSTLDWWKTQKNAPISRKDLNICDVISVLDEMAVYLKNVEEVWSNSPTFDGEIMKSLYRSFDMQRPWDYRKDRDFRTFRKTIADLTGWKYEGSLKETEHTAAEDAMDQMVELRWWMGKIELAGKALKG